MKKLVTIDRAQRLNEQIQSVRPQLALFGRRTDKIENLRQRSWTFIIDEGKGAIFRHAKLVGKIEHCVRQQAYTHLL